MAQGGFIKRLMTQEQTGAAATVSPSESTPPADPVRQPEPVKTVGSSRDVRTNAAQDTEATSPPAVRASVSLLASLGPIFRAALVYPGVDAPAGAWAGAVRRMSEVSTKLTDQLAQMQRDEIDIAWARRELHPALVKIVAEFWIAGVLRREGVRDVEDVTLRPEDMLPGLIAAERALQSYARTHEPVDLPMEAELLPALSLVTVNAQAYANMLRASAGIEVSVDAYVRAVSDALIAAVNRGADRADMPGLDRQSFTRSLLGASTGIVVKACEVAINEALQQLADAVKSGAAAPALPESGFPVERSGQLIEAGVSRLAGTYAYIAKQLGVTGG